MPNYGNDSMHMRTGEATRLSNMMGQLGLDQLPKAGELHSSYPEFLRFSHKSFANVYNGIKRRMTRANETIPPDSDEEEEGECQCAYFEPKFHQNSPFFGQTCSQDMRQPPEHTRMPPHPPQVPGSKFSLTQAVSLLPSLQDTGPSWSQACILRSR